MTVTTACGRDNGYTVTIESGDYGRNREALTGAHNDLCQLKTIIQIKPQTTVMILIFKLTDQHHV